MWNIFSAYLVLSLVALTAGNILTRAQICCSKCHTNSKSSTIANTNSVCIYTKSVTWLLPKKYSHFLVFGLTLIKLFTWPAVSTWLVPVTPNFDTLSLLFYRAIEGLTVTSIGCYIDHVKIWSWVINMYVQYPPLIIHIFITCTEVTGHSEIQPLEITCITWYNNIFSITVSAASWLTQCFVIIYCIQYMFLWSLVAHAWAYPRPWPKTWDALA